VFSPVLYVLDQVMNITKVKPETPYEEIFQRWGFLFIFCFIGIFFQGSYTAVLEQFFFSYSHRSRGLYFGPKTIFILPPF
jgi:hypothetical protein